MSDTPRCRRIVRVILPDDPPYIAPGLTLQCDKPAGHSGKHRNNDPITWSDPGADALDREAAAKSKEGR